MGIPERLREERDRLGLTQGALAEKLAATKRSVINWEGGAALPGAEVLSRYAAEGADVLYVLTGQRQEALPAADPSEQLLLENYRRCKLEAKQNLLQSSVLFAAGMAPVSKPSKPAPTKKPEARPISQRADGNGNVQIGSIGGNYGGVPLKSAAHKPKTK